jgi:predicted anti-sigma-YlaC factor YlaD
MASGFTQYSYAFVQQEADRLEGTDLEAAWEKQERARKLYLRARDYGMRALELRHRGFTEDLRRDAKAAVALARMRDVPLLYWTAAAWGAAISLSKDNADLIAEIPLVEALMDRAFALEPDFSDGAIHSFYITYEMSRAQAEGDPVERSRKHFEQAVALTKGQQAGPYVAFAESVCVQRQDRQQFETLLRQALAIDVDARPEWRLANIVMQRRANWLLSRAEDLFLAGPEKSEDNS